MNANDILSTLEARARTTGPVEVELIDGDILEVSYANGIYSYQVDVHEFDRATAEYAIRQTAKMGLL